MNILAIDTATKNLSLAVSSGGKIAAYKNQRLEKVLSNAIMPAIVGVLKKAGLALVDVDGFAAGLGPGSFTSLRVGLATIKGLALALDKPVVGIASLDILAKNVSEDGPICALMDARRQLVYGCLYENKGGVLKKRSAYLLMGIEDLMKKIKGPMTFIGDGLLLYQDRIEELSQKADIIPHFISEKLWSPQAQALAALALPQFKSRRYDDVDRLVPIYLYPEDCQVGK